MITDETVVVAPAGELDIPNALRQICAYSDLADPSAISKVIVDAIPPELLEEALRITMPYFVREHLARQRALTNPRQAQAQLVRSAKVTGIRDWWRQVLEDRVAPQGTWKRLADCTWADLDWLAASLRDKADNLIVKAQRYEKYRDMLDRYDRNAKLGDLDPRILRDLLGPLPDGRNAVEDPEDLY